MPVQKLPRSPTDAPDTTRGNTLPPNIPAASGGGPNPTDAFTIAVGIPESNAALSDLDTYLISLLLTEGANPTPTDLLALAISGLGDTNDLPTDVRSATARIWLAATTATSNVTNPANANGQNDAALATIQTVVLGANTGDITSDCGVGIPAATPISTAAYRGWFRARTTLVTSNCRLIATSVGALYADITMFTQSSVAGDTNHLGGTFTFDLIAAGVNTLAKLQSTRIIHAVTDAVAGVTPAVFDIDAGAIELGAIL